MEDMGNYGYTLFRTIPRSASIQASVLAAFDVGYAAFFFWW